MLRFLLHTLAVLLLAPSGWGYDISTYNGQPITWDPGSVTMRLQLGSDTTLSDGTTYNSSVQAAMQTWNAQIGTVQFVAQTGTTAPPTEKDGINQIGFDSTVYGSAFDTNVLAITVYYYYTTPRSDGTYQRSQADIIFNTAYTWDSYRGSLRAAEDIRRVAAHELGHVLGLKHPDEATPVQDVTALMNSHVSDLEALADDDITGMQSLYGPRNTAPAITGQPSNQTVFAGETAQFTASASGIPMPTFRWQRLPTGSGIWADLADGGNYAGTGTASLSVASTGTSMNGDQFRCVATNRLGSVTSSFAILTVNPVIAPTISGLPASLTLSFGDSLSLSPTVTGTQPMTFQWRKDGVAVSGATTGSYGKSSTTPADSGVYTLAATNAGGTVISTSVTVTVDPATAPVITQQPISQTVLPGVSVSLSVTALGTPPLTYQWYLNGQIVSGATLPTLNIPAIQAGDYGSYTAVISNVASSVTSDAATLSEAAMAGVVAASAGGLHSLFVRSDGTLWAVGYNNYGQLGDGTATERHVPVQVAIDVVAAFAGYSYSLFIKADGTLWGMGCNLNGQLGDGTVATRYSPVQIASGVASASAGGRHSLFIKADGTLWAMGSNFFGQLGDGTLTERHSPIPVATEIAAIAAGTDHSLYIKADGSTWAVGYGQNGGLGNGSYVNYLSTPVQVATGVLAVTTGSDHSLFVKPDGELWGTGLNYYGALGDQYLSSNNFNPQEIATGVVSASAGSQDTVFIKSDGTLWGMGLSYNWSHSPMQLQIATGVCAADSGGDFCLFIKPDGTLWARGYNDHGKLGDGTTYLRRDPVQIAHGSLIVPNAPAGLGVIGGPLENKIRVTWSPVIGAAFYEVWRSTNNDSASATCIANHVPFPLYYDLTIIPRMVYYYWVKAENPAGASPLSGSDSGFAGGIAPVFTTQPTGQAVTAGNTVTFIAISDGTPAPTYQWRKNGVNIAGATSSSYLITSTVCSDTGVYSVVATNRLGSTVSASVALAVYPLSASALDTEAYLAMNPDVAAAIGDAADRFAQAWVHYWTYGLAEGRPTGDGFVVDDYLAINPDLQAVFGTDRQGALLHWLTYGKLEGRMGCVPSQFELDTYFALNPDVLAVFGNNRRLAWFHYATYGILEGRSLDGWFSPAAYLAMYPDLVPALGGKPLAALGHWFRYGRAEGRGIPAWFDIVGYLARYPDIEAAYGTDLYGAWRHFVRWGAAAGRSPDPKFDPVAYLAAYPELRAGLGNDPVKALQHWIDWGKQEGKLGTMPAGWDPAYYLAHNPDLAAFGDDAAILWQHCIQWGVLEGREVAVDVKPSVYLALNPDLNVAFGGSQQKALLHWYLYGKAEGRLGR